MRRRAPLPPPGGISHTTGEILISVTDLLDVEALAMAFGPSDGFTKDLRLAAAEAFRVEEVD